MPTRRDCGSGTVWGDVALHVAFHGVHHRGQIALLVRENGGKPAHTDFIQGREDERGQVDFKTAEIAV
jgi:uncharacterized damage-inducible protein DinB